MNNFKRVNTWIKVGIGILIVMLALQELRYETSIVDWFDPDDWQWLFIAVAFNMIYETILGCVRCIREWVKNLKTKKEEA